METAFDGVAQTLSLIETYLDQLRTVAHPESLRTDIREQRFIARTLQIALQAAKDTAAQITDLEDSGDQRNGAHVFRQLAKNGWIPEPLLPRLLALNRFRQTLIHKADVGSDVIEEAFREVPGPLLDFVSTIRSGTQPLSDVSSLAEALVSLGFGRIEERVVLSVFLAIRGEDPAGGLRQVAAENLQDALSQTRSAFRKAIVFLRDTALFPHVSLLPSRGALPILAVFFHAHGAPGPRTRQLLTRWTWRRAVQGSQGATRSWQETIRAGFPRNEDEAVKGLLADVSATPLKKSGPLRFDPQSAETRLHLAVLAALHPRHLMTGEEIEIAALCETPDGPAVSLSAEPARLASHLLHPQLEEAQLRDRLAECSDEEILRSHLISATSQEALRRKNLKDLLDSREEDLRHYIESFLQSKAEWNASDRDRPALASLIVSDESAGTEADQSFIPSAEPSNRPQCLKFSLAGTQLKLSVVQSENR